MKEFDEIDELFGSAFKEFEVTPPSELKSVLDEKIFSSKRKGGFWYFGLSLLMMIAFISTNVAVRFEQKNHVANSIEISSKVAVNSVEPTLSNKNNDELKDGNTPILSKQQTQKAEQISQFISGEKSGESAISNPKNVKSVKKVSIRQERSNSVNKNGSDKFSMLPKGKLDQEILNELGQIENENLKVSLNEISIKEEQAIEEVNIEVNVSKETDISKVEDTVHLPQLSENELPTLSNQKRLGHYFQFYGGSGFSLNNLKNEPAGTSLEANQPAMEFGGEFAYVFGDRLSLSTGMNFSSYSERYSENQAVSDSTFIGFQEVIVFNPISQQDDTTYVAQYNVIVSDNFIEQTRKLSSFSIPIYATWTLNREDKYEFSVSGGVRFHYNKMRITSGEEFLTNSTINDFGLSAMVRPEFFYNFSKIGLGAYLVYTRDFIPAMKYGDLERSRQLIGGGLMLRYRF